MPLAMLIPIRRPNGGQRRAELTWAAAALLIFAAPSHELGAQSHTTLPSWPMAASPPSRSTIAEPAAWVGALADSTTEAWAASEATAPISGVGPPSHLESLLQLAFAQHPELEQGTAAIDRETGLRHQATRWPNPVVGYAAAEIGQGGRSGQQGVFWSQEWVTAGKLNLADQVGQWRTVAAGAQLEVQRLRLSRRVQSQYWTWVAARKRVRLFSELEELLSEAVRMNEALIQAAEIGRGTVLQAKLERSQIAVAKRQAQIDLTARQQALAATLGVEPLWLDSLGDDPWPALNREAAGSGLPGPSSPANEHQIASPELAVARARWETAKCELKLAEVEIVSNVSSQASVQHDALSNDVIVSLQMGIALPITDRKRGLVQAARAQVAENQAQYAALERQILARLADAQGQYQQAQEMVATIEADLLSLAQERLDLARQAHQQGEIDYLDLLTAQRSFLAIQQTALDTQEQAALAQVRLQTFAVEDAF